MLKRVYKNLGDYSAERQKWQKAAKYFKLANDYESLAVAYYKMEDFDSAAVAFEDFVKKFPDDELCADALFWGGESYRMDKNIPKAFQFYNRCRWDFASSDAAKYALGRLALPELLAQFEREANLEN